MENRTDIGSLVKERLTALDRLPSNAVWKGIEEELHQKRKKRRAFFWIFLIATSLGILLTLTVVSHTFTPTSHYQSDASKKDVSKKSSSKTSVATTTSKKQPKALFTIEKQKSASQINNTTTVLTSSLKRDSRKNTNATTKTLAASKKKKHPNSKSSKNSTTQTFAYTQNNNILSKENNSSLETKTTFETSSTAKTDNTLMASIDATNKPLDSLKNNLKKNQPKEIDTTQIILENKRSKFNISPYLGISFLGTLGAKNTLFPTANPTNENSKPAFVFGVLGRWMGTERLGLQTGIGMLQSYREQTIFADNPYFLSTSNIALETPSPTLYSWIQNDAQVMLRESYQYIEVPVEVYYIWSEKKLGLASAVGFSIMFLTSNKIYIESPTLDSVQIGANSDLTKQSLTANAKLNLFYPLSNKIQIDLYPEMQFHLMSNRNNKEVTPYYFSLKAGVSYKL